MQFLYCFQTKQLGKVYGVESFVLGPKESKELYPLMNVDDLYGTLHSPGDGTIDPASWATTLTRAAVKNGGKVGGVAKQQNNFYIIHMRFKTKKL